MNIKRPGDDSIKPQDLGVLKHYVEAILAALRACGVSPDTADQKPMPNSKPKRYSETLADLIAEGLLKPETKLQPLKPLKPGLATQATVLPDGQLQIEGQTFTSLSGAAKFVTGTVAVAGWDFWGAPSDEGPLVSLFDLRERLRLLRATAEVSVASGTAGDEAE
jgi:hypothetical protein